jgi:hypothetical protein
MIEIDKPKIDVCSDIDKVATNRFNYYSFDGW